MKKKIYRMADPKPPDQRRKFWTHEGKRYRVMYTQDTNDLRCCNLCEFDNTGGADMTCPYVEVKESGEVNEHRACVVLEEGEVGEMSYFVRATKQGWAEYIARSLE